MSSHHTSNATLEGCLSCGGVFLDRESRHRVVAAKCADTAAASDAAAAQARWTPDVRKRIACPVCGKPMTTTQVAGAVDLDSCNEHGAWFDRDELRRFIDALSAQRAKPSAKKGSGSGKAVAVAAVGAVAVGGAASSGVTASDALDVAETGFSLLELVGEILGALAD